MCRAKGHGGRRCTPHRSYQAVSNSRRRVQRGEAKLAKLEEMEAAGEEVPAEKKKRLEEKIAADRAAYERDVAHYQEVAHKRDETPVAEQAPSETTAEASQKEEAKQTEKVTENTPGAVSVADLQVGDQVRYYNSTLVATTTVTDPKTGEQTKEEAYADIAYTGKVVELRDNVGDIGMPGVKVVEADGTAHYLNEGQYAIREKSAPKTPGKVPSKAPTAEEEPVEAPEAPAPKQEEAPAPKKPAKSRTKKQTPPAPAPTPEPVADEAEDTTLDDIDGPVSFDDEVGDIGGSFEDWARREGFTDILDDDESAPAPVGGNPLFDDEDDEGDYDDADGWGWSRD